jgi:hypothetical protein
MEDCEKGQLLSGDDNMRPDLESGYEPAPKGRKGELASRPYADHGNSGRYRHTQHGSEAKQFRCLIKRAFESFFTIKSFTCIILFASVVALALLLASWIILDKRPYSWRVDHTSMVSGAVSTAAIIVSRISHYLILIQCMGTGLTFFGRDL